MARRALWAVVIAVSIGLVAIASQFALVSSAEKLALREYRKAAGTGLAQPCPSETIECHWIGPNTYDVRVWQECGPKAGEGLTVRVRFGLSGWQVVWTRDHYVV